MIDEPENPNEWSSGNEHTVSSTVHGLENILSGERTCLELSENPAVERVFRMAEGRRQSC